MNVEIIRIENIEYPCADLTWLTDIDVLTHVWIHLISGLLAPKARAYLSFERPCKGLQAFEVFWSPIRPLRDLDIVHNHLILKLPLWRPQDVPKDLEKI